MRKAVKVKLSSIVQGFEFQNDESQAYLKKASGEIFLFTNEEINAAESGEDMSEHAEWYVEAVQLAKEFLDNELDYLPLPSKYDFHEYRIMEKFVLALPVEEQREEMYELIKGKGAFSRFHQGLDRFLLKDKWFSYKKSALLEFAKEWCQENRIKIEPEN